MLINYKATPIDAKTFVIEEKTPLSQSLCYLVCGEDRALLVDAGMPLGNIKKTVDRLTKLPVTVVNTHAHVDHIGSNFRFDDICYHEADREVFDLHTNAEYLESQLVKLVLSPALTKLLGPVVKRLITPKKSGSYYYFRDGHVFHLGGRELEVIHIPGHSLGSVCLLDRENRLLFNGDSLCEMCALLHLDGCASVEVFLASARRIKAMTDDFDLILPGHHGWPVDKTIIDDYIECCLRILDGTVEMDGQKAKYGRVYIELPQNL